MLAREATAHARGREEALASSVGLGSRMLESAEELAEVIYETEERLRAEHEHGTAMALWTPWAQQTSRRERQIYIGVAKQVIRALRRPPSPREE